MGVGLGCAPVRRYRSEIRKLELTSVAMSPCSSDSEENGESTIPAHWVYSLSIWVVPYLRMCT